MIVDLADKLIDRCLQLIGYARSRREKGFMKFIEDPYQNFCELHEEYLKTFQGYRERFVKGCEGDIPGLLDEIRRDAVFSTHKRSYLVAAVESAPPDDFSTFLSSIKAYLNWDGPGMRLTSRLPYDAADHVQGFVRNTLRSILSNRARGVAICMLSEIQQSSFDAVCKRRASITVIDEIVATLQELYNRVTQAYFALRKDYKR